MFDHKYNIDDVVYFIKMRRGYISTGVKCSFCNGTGKARWDESGNTSCNAKSFPYICVDGEINKEVELTHVQMHTVRGVRVEEKHKKHSPDSCSTVSEAWYYFMNHRTMSEKELFSSREAAELAAIKINESRKKLFCAPDEDVT